MEMAIVAVALIAYFGFRQWMLHHRRIMIHRERMAAIEKGVDLPPLAHETQRSAWTIQRLLLLVGMINIGIGVSAWVVLTALLSYPRSHFTEEIPPGMQWIGVAPIAVGAAHLITYWVGQRREAARR